LAGTIGIIGGTGAEGKGLAARFASAGYDVVLGSRSVDRAEAAAAAVSALAGTGVRGVSNLVAAATADILVLTLPFEGLAETLPPLAANAAGKLVISTVVPLRFSRARVGLISAAGGSAAADVQALLPEAHVVGAFHNLSASHLSDLDYVFDGDVIVTGDDEASVQKTIELASLIRNVRGVNGGPLANCHYVEGLTALQVNINRIYKATTYVRIAGI
jgi:NADPH-dependent F420 reductase